MQGNKIGFTKRLRYGQKTVLWHLIMLVLTIGSAVLIPVLHEEGQPVSSLYYIFAAALTFCASCYAFFFELELTEGILFWLTPLLYVISSAFVLLFDRPLLLPFWCFGGILLLCAFHVRYGLLLNYFFLFLIGSTQPEPSIEALVMQVLCLFLLGIVIPYMKKWSDAVNVIISVAAVIASVRIIFFFAVKQEILSGDIFFLTAVYAGVIVVSLLFSKLLRGDYASQIKKECFDFLEELAAGEEEKEAAYREEEALRQEFSAAQGEPVEYEQTEYEQIEYEQIEQTEDTQLSASLENVDLEKLQKLCNEEAPLLVRLSAEHPTAFLHARRVAQIAGQVAEQMEEADSLLTMTGGYYHEIGRLYGRNTLENTLALAQDEEFPAALKKVLLEHTLNGDHPTSKEAAVLLLADNICGTCEYLKKTQKGRILIVKVIDKALSLRVAKGDLNRSGLTVKDFSVIRNTMAEIIKEDMF